MTVGENIRRLRKQRGMTLKQLGDAVGVSESYIRAYESGRRNPKLKSLEAIANALHVNIEVLTGADFDGIKAMHQLFHIFRQYTGTMVEVEGDDGILCPAISFATLLPMRSWFSRYEKYLEDLEKCNCIDDKQKREEAILRAEADFDFWMDTYPEYEGDYELLDAQAKHDKILDIIGLNPKNIE